MRRWLGFLLLCLGAYNVLLVCEALEEWISRTVKDHAEEQ